MFAEVVYVWAHLAQCLGPLWRAQVAQVFACGTFALFDKRTPLVVIAILVALVHAAYAVTLLDMELLGDCRACCNESYACKCGKKKKAIPLGTLRELVRLNEEQRLRQLESR